MKRRLLCSISNYNIHPNARIGLSWVNVERLDLADGARIGNFNLIRKLHQLKMERCSTIGQRNFVTCFRDASSNSFSHIEDRVCSLVLGQHAAITIGHLVDCNAPVRIGEFTTIAGYGTQILTHSIDIYANRQDAKPLEIGDYCFVGTRCVLLGGSSLPSYSVLGAGAVLNKAFDHQYALYAGVPASEKKSLPVDLPYFKRTVGSVE